MGRSRESPGTGQTVAPVKTVRRHGSGTDRVAVRIKVTKNINQKNIPVKGSTQVGRIYGRPDIPPENQESYQASSAPDGAVGKGGTPSPSKNYKSEIKRCQLTFGVSTCVQCFLLA